MGIFDAINVSESAMSVHRFRSEIAAQNVANVHTAGYKRQEVDLRASNFESALNGARSGTNHAGPSTVGGMDAADGAVQVSRVRKVDNGEYDERQNALLATTDMMRAKSAFELNVKAATLLKSMALSSLEIGRGS
jgi:flagellar basal body rod protein FlgC